MTHTLESLGILGINSRNLDYLFPNNPRHLYKLADSKLETKQIAEQVGVPTPETYGVIQFQNEVRQLSELVSDRPFVIKPGNGSGGDGIQVNKSNSEPSAANRANFECLKLP